MGRDDRPASAACGLPGELGGQIGGTDRDEPERLHHFFVLYALGAILDGLAR
jgi:hypothetical protein